LRKTFRQPKDALNSSAFSVKSAERWALERAMSLPKDLFRLKALWYINYVLQPTQEERKTRYTMKIAHSENYGISAGLTPVLPDPDPDLVGQDTREILKAGACRDYIDRVAVVDSVIGHVSRPADAEIRLDDTPQSKYGARTEIFADEVKRVLRCKGPNNLKGKKPHVVVIGATAGIIGALLRRGLATSASDLALEVIGKELAGVKVENGKTANPRLIKKADLAIITGMTLPNRLLQGLIKLAKKYNTSTIIWAITGKNFGHYYTEHGVDSVISDPSPFLLLPGPATIAIWRRRN
jgi:hypothetical protein